MFGHINTLNIKLLQVKGRSDIFLNIDIVKKGIAILLLFAAIPFGMIGICISKILGFQISIVINTYCTGKIFSLGYFKQMKDFWGFFVLSLISCLQGYLVSEYVDVNPFVSLLFGLIIAPSIYIYLLRNNKYMLMVLSIVKEKLSVKVRRVWK